MMHEISKQLGSREQLLVRPRIDNLLDKAFSSSLVVLHAGAGFGKTVSLAQYLGRSKSVVVWFSVSAADNVPERFWKHLTRIFAQHKPDLEDKMCALGFPDTPLKFGQFIVDLTDELYQDEKNVVFVFDDAGVLTEPAVLTFLENIVTTFLENSTMVFSTRIWPLFVEPLPVIPQLINTAQLQFSLGETITYMRMVGLELSDDVVADIHHYIKGWPIALSLVALSIKNGSPHDIPDLSITKPALFALFEQQIFSQYTKDEQDLLIRLSVLDSFPRGLIRAVSGGKSRDLTQLINGNIFIKYDSESERLSCHPLYLEFLREKVRDISKADLNETYQKAADWCLENGFYHDAAEYYQRSSQYRKLWQVLQRMEVVRRSFSEAEFFIDQITKMPDDFKKKNPLIKLVHSLMLANNLRFEEARAILDEVEIQLWEEGLIPETAALQDTAALQEPKPGDSGPDRQEPKPRDSDLAQSDIVGEYYLARALLLFAWEKEGFEIFFGLAAKFLPEGSRRWGNRLELIDLGPALSLHSPDEGELEKRLVAMRKAVPSMVSTMNGAGRGLDSLCESEALFLQGETRLAIEPAYQALYSSNGVAQYDIAGNALFMLLRCYIAQGKYDMVIDTMEHVERYEADNEAKHLGIWDIIRAWLYADVGETERVALWIRNPVQKGFAPLSLDRPMLVRLRCLISAGQHAEARALLDQIEAMPKSENSIITLVYAYLARAIIDDSFGNTHDAASSLADAFELAEGNRLFMPFIEYGSRTRALLEHVRKMPGQGVPDVWIGEMYAKSSTYAKRLSYVASRYKQEYIGKVTDYHLSLRETELLLNLSQGLTREETAEAMQLSINTVKSLTKQAFAKLGAINTADAVRIATANKLLK